MKVANDSSQNPANFRLCSKLTSNNGNTHCTKKTVHPIIHEIALRFLDFPQGGKPQKQPWKTPSSHSPANHPEHPRYNCWSTNGWSSFPMIEARWLRHELEIFLGGCAVLTLDKQSTDWNTEASVCFAKRFNRCAAKFLNDRSCLSSSGNREG